MKIAHISDLHVSSPYFVSKWGDNIVDFLNSSGIDLVLITGDLTMDGHPHEFDIAMELINRIQPDILAVPGNHDAKNKGYEVFEEIFGTRKPVFENDRVSILGLDSSEPDIDEGQIGRHNYQTIRDRLGKEKPSILALHHHVVPVPWTGRERNILTDAGDVLQVCMEAGVDLVLSGHRHLPWTWKIQNTHFITAGTACTRRLKGRTGPSFNMFDLKETGFDLTSIDSRDLSERYLLSSSFTR